MRKISLILSLIISVSSHSFSQKNLKPGFIITNQFDTIYGFIDYRNDLFNCSRCVFYTDEKSDQITFNPGDIHAYRFTDDRYYISRNVKVGPEEKTCFVEYLVNGITNLYYLRDNAGDHYFIEKGNEIYELTNKVSLITVDNKEYTKESNFYVGQMKIIYSDSQEILPDIDKTKFDRESMMKLSEKYHSLVCKDRSCLVYEKKIRKVILNFGPVLSYRWASYSYPEAYFAQFTYNGFLSPFNFRTAQTLYTGIAVSAKFPSISEKLALRIRGLYGKESNSNSYTNTEFSQTMNNYLEYEKSRIITSLDIRYDYPRGKIRPTASLGGELSFVPDQKSLYIEKVYNYAGELTETISSDEMIRFNSGSGLFANVGLLMPVGRHDLLLEYFYNYSWGWYQWSRETSGYPLLSGLLWTSARSRESSMGLSISFLF